MIKIESPEDLADFTRGKISESGLSVKDIAKKLRVSYQHVGSAIEKNKRGETSRNGIRSKILNLLGYEVKTVFVIKRQNV